MSKQFVDVVIEVLHGFPLRRLMSIIGPRAPSV